jgi:hypothetical protein
MKLLTPAHANTKTAKNDTNKYLSAILHLAPANVSGYNVCLAASNGCKSACLNTAGRGRFNNVQQARIRKTKLFFENQNEFIDLLIADCKALIRKANRLGLTPVIRLNGTSDIDWSKVNVKDCTEFENIFMKFPEIQFYDYTKHPDRVMKYLGGGYPSNYNLTFSQSECNQLVATKLLNQGANVAIVFDQVPSTYLGYQVVNGDNTDLRFLDPKNVVIGLTAKGKAKKDTSGFVVKLSA